MQPKIKCSALWATFFNRQTLRLALPPGAVYKCFEAQICTFYLKRLGYGFKFNSLSALPWAIFVFCSSGSGIAFKKFKAHFVSAKWVICSKPDIVNAKSVRGNFQRRLYKKAAGVNINLLAKGIGKIARYPF